MEVLHKHEVGMKLWFGCGRKCLSRKLYHFAAFLSLLWKELRVVKHKQFWHEESRCLWTINSNVRYHCLSQFSFSFDFWLSGIFARNLCQDASKRFHLFICISSQMVIFLYAKQISLFRNNFSSLNVWIIYVNMTLRRRKDLY